MRKAAPRWPRFTLEARTAPSLIWSWLISSNGDRSAAAPRPISAYRPRLLPVDDHAHIGVEHLFAALKAVFDSFGGIRVVRIRGGIVPMGRHFHLRALRQLKRFFQVVDDLPVKIVMRHVEQRLRLASRIDQSYRHVFPAHMHMRLNENQFYRFAERQPRVS